MNGGKRDDIFYQMYHENPVLTCCSLGFFPAFLLSADCFPEKIFQEYLLSVEQIGARSGLTLRPNCLQRLSVDDTRRQRVKVVFADLPFRFIILVGKFANFFSGNQLFSLLVLTFCYPLITFANSLNPDQD